MIKSCTSALAVFAVLAGSSGYQARALQPVAPTAHPSSDEDQIRLFALRWGAAEVARDRKTLEHILDDSFLATFGDGHTFEKADFIDLIMKMNLPPMRLAHDFIRIHGNTAIIVTRFGFGDTLGTKCTWVAIRRNGEWRAIAEHMSEIEQPKPVPASQPPQK